MPGPTWPNRLFVHAGSSSGLHHSPSTLDTVYYMTFGFGFQNGTIFDRLHDADAPWMLYHGDDWPQAFAPKGMRSYSLSGHLAPRFVGDLQANYQPAYTFIEPSYGAATHD